MTYSSSQSHSHYQPSSAPAQYPGFAQPKKAKGYVESVVSPTRSPLSAQYPAKKSSVKRIKYDLRKLGN